MILSSYKKLFRTFLFDRDRLKGIRAWLRIQIRPKVFLQQQHENDYYCFFFWLFIFKNQSLLLAIKFTLIVVLDSLPWPCHSTAQYDTVDADFMWRRFQKIEKLKAVAILTETLFLTICKYRLLKLSCGDRNFEKLVFENVRKHDRWYS